jgi:hypothetical protein
MQQSFMWANSWILTENINLGSDKRVKEHIIQTGERRPLPRPSWERMCMDIGLSEYEARVNLALIKKVH